MFQLKFFGGFLGFVGSSGLYFKVVQRHQHTAPQHVSVKVKETLNIQDNLKRNSFTWSLRENQSEKVIF